MHVVPWVFVQQILNEEGRGDKGALGNKHAADGDLAATSGDERGWRPEK
jgi:hypothetical protein